jgi:hypothetical protein
MDTCVGVTDRVRLVGIAVGIASQPADSGRSLDGIGERGVVAPRPVEAEPGHPQHDGVGPNRLDGREIQPNLVDHPRGEVLDYDIAGRDQPVQHFTPGGALQVERQTLLIRVEAREDRRLLPPLLFADGDACDQPGAVRPAGRLHMDDVGAQHRQNVRARRSRPERRHVQNAQPLERQRRRTGVRSLPLALSILLGVLAEPRRRLRRTKTCGLHAVRVAGLTEPVAGVCHERPARLEMVQRIDVRAVGHRRIGDPERRGQVPDLIDGVVGDPGAELAGLLVGLLGDRQR